jgi:Bax protein
MKHLLISVLFINSLFAIGLPKEYYDIKDTKQMKSYFFNFINELALKENQLIVKDRKFVKDFYPKKELVGKNTVEYNRFKSIQKRYKLKDDDTLQKYLNHIDIIPNSLVIAQAAVESGWGKSRFVKQANNIFGQWTWSGKGLVPSSRNAGAKHKIKIFNSLADAVKGYMINLNLGWGYKELRNVRAKLRKLEKPLTGVVLSKTLVNYSQKREEYTKLLAKIIKRNNLTRFDK